MTFNSDGTFNVSVGGLRSRIEAGGTWVAKGNRIEVHRAYDGGVATYKWDRSDLVLVDDSSGVIPSSEVRLKRTIALDAVPP